MTNIKPVGLSLENGIRMGFMPGDEMAASLIFRLIDIMQLGPIEDSTQNIILRIEGQDPFPSYKKDGIIEQGEKKECVLWENGYWKIYKAAKEKTVICSLSMDFAEEPCNEKLRCISAIIGYFIISSGGLIIHGGYAEKDGKGVVFSGTSGAGKTTTMNRLPDRWKPLCDEHTLIVRDCNGTFWAHPLPTGSRFKEQGPGGSWNVQHSVPLEGIFFLTKDATDQVISLNKTDGAYLTYRRAEEGMVSLFEWAEPEKKKRAIMQIINNSFAFAQAMPAYILKLSLTGSFWNEVDRALNKGTIE
jgi:SynChlorMet cassette protein ScmC